MLIIHEGDLRSARGALWYVSIACVSHVRDRVVIGWCLAGLAFVLLVTAIAGIAPWVVGPDPGCSNKGPNSFFLYCWLGSVGVAAGAFACFVTARAGSVIRWGGVAIASLVPVGAVAWYVVVVIDGIQECGF